MVVAIFVHSSYCPNCELFKYGELEVHRGGKTLRFKGQGEGVESAYTIVKEVCTPVGIPVVAVDMAQILGWSDDELSFSTLGIPEINKSGIFKTKYLSASPKRHWITEVINKDVIELPSFVIKSNIARDRHVNIEIALSDPVVAMDWSAARQVLREVARAAIEEKLRLAGRYSVELQELLLMRLFPVNETGKPDIIRWIRGFVNLRHLRASSRSP